ncbi:MAG: hypothetical protein PUP90_02955 [Nostoc sp. S4]|nr:hypothetical protein [Nostoc sp. S4]
MSNRKRTLLLIFLSFFCGLYLVAIHRLYIGDTTLGILAILFCWIGAGLLLTVIDFFYFLLISDQDFDSKYTVNFKPMKPVNHSLLLYGLAGACLFIGILLAIIQGTTIPDCTTSYCKIVSNKTGEAVLFSGYDLFKEIVAIFYSDNFKWFILGLAGISFIGALVRENNGKH